MSHRLAVLRSSAPVVLGLALLVAIGATAAPIANAQSYGSGPMMPGSSDTDQPGTMPMPLTTAPTAPSATTRGTLNPNSDTSMLLDSLPHTFDFTLTAPDFPFDATMSNGYGPDTYPYYGASGYLYLYRDNDHCFPCSDNQ